MSELVCRLFRHDIQPNQNGYTHICNRCGKRDEDLAWPLPERLSFKFWNTIHIVQRKWCDLRIWFHCHECGGRFGKHAESCDVFIPF